MEADFYRLLHFQVFRYFHIHFPVPPMSISDGCVPIVIVPLDLTMGTFVPGQFFRFDGFRILGMTFTIPVRFRPVSPFNLTKDHFLHLPAGRTFDPVIENHLSLFFQGFPDIPFLRRRRADLPYFAVMPVGDCPRFAQGNGIRFLFTRDGRVFIRLIKDNVTNRLIRQPCSRSRPGHVNRHMLQADFGHRIIITDTGHIAAQCWALLDHRLDTVLVIFPSCHFIRINAEGRSRVAVDGIPQAIQNRFRAANLGSLADDNRPDRWKKRGVHDPGQVGRYIVFPFARQDRHGDITVLLSPPGNRDLLAFTENFPLRLRKTDAMTDLPGSLQDRRRKPRRGAGDVDGGQHFNGTIDSFLSKLFAFV